MPKFGTVRWTIKADGCGGFLSPPTHPKHNKSIVSERWTNHGWDMDWFMSLDSSDEWIPAGIRARAQRILAEWTPPPMADRDVQLWIKACWSHWRNCYDIGERDLFVMQSRPFGNLPTVNGRGLEMILNIADHYAAKMIRSFYPEYLPSIADMGADCADCRHHVNAHANGAGGICTVIVDPNGWELAKHDRNYDKAAMLCNCPSFALVAA